VRPLVEYKPNAIEIWICASLASRELETNVSRQRKTRIRRTDASRYSLELAGRGSKSSTAVCHIAAQFQSAGSLCDSESVWYSMPACKSQFHVYHVKLFKSNP
jgi:hypothetical protein